MRLLIAAAGGYTAYLIVGLFLNVAPDFRRQKRQPRPGRIQKWLAQAVTVGPQARELLGGSPHNSMAAVAAQAVGTADRIAVLGSGIMATAVVDGLLLLPAPPEVALSGSMSITPRRTMATASPILMAPAESRSAAITEAATPVPRVKRVSTARRASWFTRSRPIVSTLRRSASLAISSPYTSVRSSDFKVLSPWMPSRNRAARLSAVSRYRALTEAKRFS